MYKKANKLVQLGDQFVHLGDEIKTIWEVVSLIDSPHLPPHARIREAGKQKTHLTSVSALLDESFYEPTERKSVATPEPVVTLDPVVTLEPFVTLASVVSLEPIVASIPQNNINDRTTDLFGEQVQQAKR
jgi:hypothetical protein